MSQIQEKYQKPQEELAVLKAAASSLLSKHNHELQAAEELVREAKVKTQESSRLLLIVSANLQEFTVSFISCSPLQRAIVQVRFYNQILLHK